MQQCLHVLVVDRRRRTALIQAVGRRWMLPVVACGERARAPLVAARWLADRQLTGVVAGQWVGRIAANGRSIDWLIAIAAGLTVESPPLSWASLDCLEATTAVLDYQAWALDQVVTRGGIAVSGPFGSLDWIDHARSWIESAGLSGLSSLRCFRASGHDVVLGMRTGSAEVYFKGAAPDRASDLHAIATAARTLPESFPRTLALEERSDSTRWLLEGCAGVPLARLRHHDDAVRVAFDIGRVQQRLAPESLQSTLNLNDILDDADGLLEPAGLPSLSAPTRRAFDEVMSLPEGWTPLDLDPCNVFIDGRQIHYIDLEPRITAMPMAVSVFARRLAATGDLLHALHRAYESASGERVPWPSMDLVTEVTEILSGWYRALRNVERGEVSGPLDHVARAVRKQLASAKLRV
jgi:hypothetical protein